MKKLENRMILIKSPRRKKLEKLIKFINDKIIEST